MFRLHKFEYIATDFVLLSRCNKLVLKGLCTLTYFKTVHLKIIQMYHFLLKWERYRYAGIGGTPTFWSGTPTVCQMGVLNSCFQNLSESSVYCIFCLYICVLWALRTPVLTSYLFVDHLPPYGSDLYLGVSGYNFQKIFYSFALRSFLSLQPVKTLMKCSISSGSSLFAKVLI